jgi:hypothetical protein
MQLCSAEAAARAGSALRFQMSCHTIEVSSEGYQIGLDIAYWGLFGEFSQSFGNFAVTLRCRLFSVVHGNTRRATLLTQRGI